MPANQLRYGAAKHPTEGANYGEESYHVGHPEFSRYSPSYSNLQKIVDEVQACNLHFQLPEKKMAMKPQQPKASTISVFSLQLEVIPIPQDHVVGVYIKRWCSIKDIQVILLQSLLHVSNISMKIPLQDPTTRINAVTVYPHAHPSRLLQPALRHRSIPKPLKTSRRRPDKPHSNYCFSHITHTALPKQLPRTSSSNILKNTSSSLPYRYPASLKSQVRLS
mmetsp:Transcript_5585/g.23715  ORF Transcript_5585/g.23715 Transcript_5585/m.23715 type:complete len:221 (+) Transcript_5585:2189-2851(+)